jgi:Fe-S-cluster-containing hydrogenase component 2
MKDCPPDAIRRAPNGEVFIRDNCIGCGNCERNCPYGVIHMAAAPPEQPGLLARLLFGAVGTEIADSKDAVKKAVKCDMCSGQAGGPACVRACPTGAAIRVSPEKFVKFVSRSVR